MTELFYPLTSLGVLTVVAAYAYALVMVGRARGKHGVKVPETTGPEPFVRAFRAHQNSVEQMVIFLPLVVILSGIFGDLIGAIYAFTFAAGRFLFVRGYNIAAEKRTLGFQIGLFASLAALIACIVGVIVQLAT
jgi:uncharacterized MAPEG superfamily protein